MSVCTWLAASKPLPFVEAESITVAQGVCRIDPVGFSVEPDYYASSPDLPPYAESALPYRYELLWDSGAGTAEAVRRYLAEHLEPGDCAQLWRFWLGIVPPRIEERAAPKPRRGKPSRQGGLWEREAVEDATITRPAPDRWVPLKSVRIPLADLSREHLDILNASDGMCITVEIG